MITTLIVAVLIFILVVWLIGFLPLPASRFPIREMLYVLAIIVLVLYLLRFV